jgi:subtilisin-like proprotein convertase family protein
MRKIYFLLFTLFTFFAFRQNISAQLANTYVYLSSTGATLDPMTGSTQVIATGDDDTPSAIQNIGFTFNYEGVAYTQFSVSPDGFIKLGSPAASSQFTNAITSTTNVPKLFPFWDDMATGTSGNVSFVVNGASPNRILVVQWFVTVPRNTGGAANSTMQAWLYETGGKIEFRYGAVGGASGSASIGINGAVATNFISLTTPSNASSTTTANDANTAWPGNGTMYTFFPPPPCANPLNGGTISPATFSACSGTNFSLSVTGASFGTGIVYQWESSPDGITGWTAVAGGATQTLTTNQTVTTWYRRKMNCSGGADFYSNTIQVTMNAPTACYCIPPATNCNLSDVITNVTLGVLNNSTACSVNGYTSYLTGQPVPSLSRTVIYPMAVTVGPGGTEFVGVWIDYNQNGVFETTEFTALGSANGATINGNITIPVGALLGNTGMRVRVRFNTALAGTDACTTYSFGETEDYTVNIAPAPACSAPTGLAISALTPTTATASWTAPGTPPANGYEWEVRTSGAGGSGGAGLVSNGATAATTTPVGGLSPNTNYSLYVRSVCAVGTNYSLWSGPFAFLTPCLPIGTPFTETFATFATTFPPTCWTRNNSTFLFGDASSGNGIGTGSALFDFFDADAGTALDLTSPTFTPVPTGYRLTFDEAYATFFGEVDQLQILYSTDGGNSYNALAQYDGGTAGPLNTGGAVFGPFFPSATQWQNFAIDLPVGTNRLLFRGLSAFGNILFLDNITVEQTPSCLPVTNVVAVPVSPTAMIVSFTPPATTPTAGYIVEYGPPGFTPGTTNVAGPGGTVVVGPGSPITIGTPGTPLTPSTTYDVYVRKMCILGVDFSTNKKVTATTLCNSTTIPYLQTFESSVVPGPPTCTSVEDRNGNNGPGANTGGGSWFTFDGAGNPQTYISPTKTIRYLYDAGNSLRPADDWFYLQGLSLTGGNTYRLKFFFKGSDGPTWIESLEVKYGTLAHSSAMTNLIYTNNNIATALASPFDSAVVDFTPPANGVYYIGFHAISLADQAFLYLENVSVKTAPLVDVGISDISTTPSLNCPASNVFIQATVRNYNTTTVDFGLHPVNVTGTITGAATANPSASLTSGTLAAGASMTIYLSPAVNFTTPGQYNITVKTSTVTVTDDPETANDALTIVANVNPNPPAPTITPASPVNLCVGGQALLSTQFTPPPPPVTVTASSGTIAIAIPDNTPAGISHTIPVSGIPAGATVIGVSVTINKLAHTFDGDLIINLQAPNGKILNLMNQEGLGGDSLISTTISSTGTTPFAAGAAPFTGTFAPDAIPANPPTGFDQSVTSFPGLYSQATQGNGNWTLAIRDNAFLDNGILRSWTISVTYQFVNPVVTWSPTAGLFTNVTTTTPYTGGDAYSLYTKPPASTTYTVTSTSIAGCTASTNVVVTVNPIPVVTVGAIPDTVCISDPLIPLVASPVGGSWSGIGVSGTNFVPPATAVGTYILSYTYSSPAGCPATATKKIAVKDCPERIILLRDNAVLLYPNPNNGQFNIKINSVLYNNLAMRVYASNGALVTSQQFGGLAWGRVIPIDLTNLPSGVYQVEFYYDGGVRTSQKTFKVIVSR